MRWLDHKRRIALTGLAGAGKTVFLLSLLQHLERFDPSRFKPAGGGEITAFKELPIDSEFELFPRLRLGAKLMEAQNLAWPQKTRDIYRYRCCFHYSSLGLPTKIWNKLRIHRKFASTRVEWDFLDFPGERLSDVHMARRHSFEDWSDSLFSLWKSYDRLRDGFGPYLALAESGGRAGAAELLASYKRCLAHMVHQKYQLITPSTFMLDQESGGVFTVSDLDNGGAERHCGLAGAEFAPLPERFRRSNPDLVQIFAANYRQYRKIVVSPLFEAINACDRLLLLVDIPGILSGGVGRYNDASHMIETLAENITPSGWFFTHVDKVALIAAKSDMIHRRDQDNLLELARDMVRIARNKQPSLRFDAFTASSWVSAKSVDLEDGSRALKAIPARDTEERIFRIPELKPEWPGDWGPEDPCYSYPLLSPPKLSNRFMAPEQRNLDRIFDFIIS